MLVELVEAWSLKPPWCDPELELRYDILLGVFGIPVRVLGIPAAFLGTWMEVLKCLYQMKA